MSSTQENGRRSKGAAPRQAQARGHDHASCVASALDSATRLSIGRGLRLTPLRRRVLELVWASHEPIGAYEVLQKLQGERAGAQPPTVYRALEFLLALGIIHRIESLNAFVGCSMPEASHVGQFLICRNCGTAIELGDQGIAAAVISGAARSGFTVERQVIEVSGRCARCQRESGGRFSP